MKISKDKLFQIVREEIANHFKALSEAPATPEVADAAKDDKSKDKGKKDAKAGKDAGKAKSAEKPTTGTDQKASDQELPDSSDDEKIEKDKEDAEDPESNAESEQAKIQQELVGKTVQSISFEPRSKILPGAQEINLTFNETPDPLRILVTRGGEIKYFYKGGLHNRL